MHVGQDRALRLHARDPGERIRDAEMARVRTVAQRVDDPDRKAGHRRQARLRQVVQVRRIRHVAEAESERRNVAVVLAERQRRELLASRLLTVYGKIERQAGVVHVVAGRLRDDSDLLGSLVMKSRDFQ